MNKTPLPWKKAFKFTLCMLPFALIAGFSLGLYAIGTGLADAALESVPESAVILSTVIQTLVYAVIFGFFGYILADRIGLVRSFRFTRRDTLVSVVCGAVGGLLLFALDRFLFCPLIPALVDYYDAYPFSLAYFAGETFYGGVIEELMMRWFLMSLFVLIFWKVFARKQPRESIPVWIFVLSNLLVGVLFALGHLPATLTLFGEINAVIFIRCMLLNGALGVVFGRLYRKRGIQYAMIAHALTHVFCDLALYIALAL